MCKDVRLLAAEMNIVCNTLGYNVEDYSGSSVSSKSHSSGRGDDHDLKKLTWTAPHHRDAMRSPSIQAPKNGARERS
jgi:hypothetical protein